MVFKFQINTIFKFINGIFAAKIIFLTFNQVQYNLNNFLSTFKN